MRLLLGLLILSLVVSCAQSRQQGTLELGSPPTSIEVTLATEIQYRAHPNDVLANPAFQSLFTECERRGFEHCREEAIPSKITNKYVKGQDKNMFGFIKLAGVEANRQYQIRCRWIDPDGVQTGRVFYSVYAPFEFQPNWALTAQCFFKPYEPSTLKSGGWHLEIEINGIPEGKYPFDIVE